VSYFNKILGPEAVSKLNSTANLTLFLPVDEAWDTLDPYERLYLESEFAADDLRRILNMHAVVMGHVEWSESFKSGDKRTSCS
jgi:solute carrier family 25 carnitine/acylcarnitine transporter 20/29